MVKKVVINEKKNEIKYIEKREIKGDYLDTILKYMCSSSGTDEIPKKEAEEYMILKNGKKVYK
tara:strand:- start:1553 stop:1741 length:189 start_codon:yes stop_codon:yes gene_type:complete